MNMAAFMGESLSRIAWLRIFLNKVLFFNIVFVYIWGYLLWGTAEIWSGEWYVDALGHMLWPGFHTWVLISSCEWYSEEFSMKRWKDEGLVWFLMLLCAVGWEWGELLLDISSQFATRAQVSSADTLIDVLLQGILTPPMVLVYKRWKNGVRLFFTDSQQKRTIEQKLRQVQVLLDQIAAESVQNDPQAMRTFRALLRKVWQENHRIQPVLKAFYEVARGSRRERRRRKALLRKIQS